MDSFKNRTRDTFRKKSIEKIVWQPRFSDWYNQNRIISLKKDHCQSQTCANELKCPDIPENIFGMEPVEIYDYLNASPRYPGECWPGMHFFDNEPDPDAEIKHKWFYDCDGNRYHKIETPFGVLTESWKAGSTYPNERILKKKEDFKPVLYYLKKSFFKFKFNKQMYEIFKEENEGRCVSVSGPWRSPYNKCIVELAGTKNTMLLMKRYTKEFDDFCEELERISLEIILPEILKSPIEFISLGDNVDCINDPPPVYEKYLLPYFNKVARECKKHGKFSYAHYDGHLRLLLPYLSNDQFPFDGIEAPTFHPQGDVSIEEFKSALGDEILVLDGIPSTVFIKQFPEHEFVRYVQNVLESFSPNLILGVSDEFPPNGLFARLERVDDIVEKFKPRIF
ncbi:MAG: hypothetical protein ACTSWN_13710 [Promethearchaeota archaeon]